MPMKSQAQRRLFWAVKNDPKLGKRLGIKKSVAAEFTASDTGGSLPARIKPKSRGDKWYGHDQKN